MTDVPRTLDELTPAWLSHFVGGSVPTAQRRSSERALVAGYGRTMRELGVDVPGDDELFDHYRRAVLLAMTVAALLMGQLDLSINQRGVDLTNVAVERIYTTGADLSVGDLV